MQDPLRSNVLLLCKILESNSTLFDWNAFDVDHCQYSCDDHMIYLTLPIDKKANLCIQELKVGINISELFSLTQKNNFNDLDFDVDNFCAIVSLKSPGKCLLEQI